MIHTIAEFCEVLRRPEIRSVALIPHQFPDGDCLGSAAALYHVLEAIGKDPVIYHNDPVPSNLSLVMEGVCSRAYDAESDAGLVVDLAIGVDSSSPKLFADRLALFEAARHRMVVDHHMTNEEYAEINYVDKTASATGECIFLIARELGVAIEPVMAQGMYAAIVTDTGSFQYSGTTARTFDIARELIATGFDFERLNVSIFQSVDPANVRALRLGLDRLSYRLDGLMATTWFHESDYAKYDFSSFETDGIVEYIRAIRGVELVVFAREIDGGLYKYSLRSKNYVDVSAIGKSFGGGGHKRASGFKSSRPLEEVFAEIEAMARSAS